MPRGTRATRGDPGEPGPSTAYRSSYPYSPPGSAIPNSPKAILNAVTVPPGSYVMFGDALIQNTAGAAEAAVCELVAEQPSSTPGGSPRTAETLASTGLHRIASNLTAIKVGEIVTQ